MPHGPKVAGATMVRWCREVKTRNGKTAAALAAAHHFADYAKREFGIDVLVFMDATGTVGTVRWMSDFTDMATYELALRKLMSSPDYLRMMDQPEVSALFIDGTTQDSLFLMV